MKKKNKGFTLIEMLVVVLIIGILAGIALPQYQMAVTKAKVASILPLMRRWKDAMYEYKLQHGSYMTEDDEWPDADTLGVSWPNDWECYTLDLGCQNDYWNCMVNERGTGQVYCYSPLDDDGSLGIRFVQPDDELDVDFQGMILCEAADGGKAHKICKALGGKLVDGYDFVYKLY